MEEWKEYKLSEVIDVKHGFAFKGEFFSDEPTQNILVTPGNFRIGGGFKPDKFKYYNGEYPSSYVLEGGDIIITMTDLSKAGDTLGYSAKVPSHDKFRFLHNQRVGLLLLKDAAFDQNFLYWLMRTSNYQNFIVSSATGTTVKHTSPSRICDYRFKAPSKATQTAIAEILSSLDDKIELNNQINKNLEALAQALFKQWFVDFEFPGENGKPYKSSGGEMVESELGEIPKGWRVGKLSDTITLTGGGTPKRSNPEFWHGNIPWFSIQDIPKEGEIFVVNTFEKITELGLEKSSTKVLPRGATIITARGTVGKLALVSTPMAMNQSCYGVSGKDGAPFFTYFNLKQAVKLLQQKTHGAVFDTITTTTFDAVTVVYGGKVLVKKFDETISVLMDSIELRVRENTNLAALRDTLLPKLISGELEVQND
jgi:type I restriction enzyme S subunit